MSTETKAIRDGAISAGVFLTFSIAIYVSYFHIFPHPFIRDLPVEVPAKIQNAKIQSTQDIEWLRGVALQLDTAQRQNNRELNEFIDALIILLIIIGISVVGLSISNVRLWVKYLRQQNNGNIPWWLEWV